MDENNDVLTQAVEEAPDQEDNFMAGWEGEDGGGPGDAPDQALEGADQRPEEAQDEEPPQSETTEGEEQGKAQEDTEQEKADQPTSDGPTWDITHLGQHRTLGVKDVTPELLQKGIDYDRVREQYDRAKPVVSLMETLAQQAGVSLEDYTQAVRVQAKQASGLSEEEARREIGLEDREAVVAQKEQAATQTEQRQAEDQAQIQASVQEFAKAFPEIYDQARKDPSVIPDSVWEAVKGGLTLTAAWAKYSVDQAKRATEAAMEQAQTAQQNQRNLQRSTGSMRTAGSNARNRDPFQEGFDE